MRNPTEDPESQQLRSLLNSISNQLSVPFLERRARNQSHKVKPVEELQDAVNELCEKERELSAAVGIAKMLLDKNDTLQLKNNVFKESINNLSDENRMLRAELKGNFERLEKGEGKYLNLTETLMKTENELLRASVEYQSYVDGQRIGKDLETMENEFFEEKEYLEKELEKAKSN